jgi:hypothetical protein
MAIMSPIAGNLYDRHVMKWIGMISDSLLVISTALYIDLTYTTGIVLMNYMNVVACF